ncbi:MAG: hypothetical protein GH150_02170, partial [Hadesarchaea archaeon]|nr:hypothetical protein [Hadesarchaea archaeon]
MGSELGSWTEPSFRQRAGAVVVLFMFVVLHLNPPVAAMITSTQDAGAQLVENQIVENQLPDNKAAVTDNQISENQPPENQVLTENQPADNRITDNQTAPENQPTDNQITDNQVVPENLPPENQITDNQASPENLPLDNQIIENQISENHVLIETWTGVAGAQAAWHPFEIWTGVLENQGTDNQVVVTFDRRLSGDRVGQHKVPPLTPVNMTITVTVSSQVENAVLADYFPSDWTVTDANGGIVSVYDENYNKIEWNVGAVSGSVSRSYVVRSPQLTSPPTRYHFHSELTYQGGSEVGDDWRVIVADPAGGTGYLWISDYGDFIYQVTTSDPETIVDSYDFGTASPFGCEENDGYIYFVDYSADTLYKKLWSDKSDAGSWAIGGYSADALGLAYGGGYFWICDQKDDQIYKVDPADPTNYVAIVTYTGISYPEGAGWNSDNSRLLIADSGTDLFYSFDVSTVGTDQGEYPLTPDWTKSTPGGAPTGIVWDGTNFWSIDDGTNSLYKHYENGDVAATYTPPGGDPQGLAFGLILGPPGKPVLVSPENAIEIYDNTPTFVWENGAGAENHRIEVDNDINFGSPGDNETVFDNTWTKPGNGYAEGTYYWRVWAVNAAGENVSENTWEFTVVVAEWNLIESWTGTVEAPVVWNLIESWTGTVEAPAAWQLIETWTGTVEAPVVWQLIETWTGTVEAPVVWQLIETWTGIIEAPVVWQLIETWTGTVEALAEWQLIETWTGAVEAPAGWQLVETWTGTIEALAEWQLIETWTGTVEAPVVWQLIETWTGTVEAPVEWQLIETWTGTVEAPVEWQLIETWTGTVQAPADWQLIETWTGTVKAPAVWQLIETWTGTVEARAEWQLIETWTGTVEARAEWQLIETWTGTV